MLTIADPEPETPMGDFDMHDRVQRKDAYEHLILQGLPEAMIRWLDGPLLVDLWDELDLPDAVRKAWHWQVVVAREPSKPGSARFVVMGSGASS